MCASGGLDGMRLGHSDVSVAGPQGALASKWCGHGTASLRRLGILACQGTQLSRTLGTGHDLDADAGMLWRSGWGWVGSSRQVDAASLIGFQCHCPYQRHAFARAWLSVRTQSDGCVLRCSMIKQRVTNPLCDLLCGSHRQSYPQTHPPFLGVTA